MNLSFQEPSLHLSSSAAPYAACRVGHCSGTLLSRGCGRHPVRVSRGSRSCRCQSLPEGSGRPLANLRAWGAELFNSLRTGWSDQPKQAAQQGSPKQPLPPQQPGGEAGRDSEALSSAPAAEQQSIAKDDDSLTLVAPDSEADEEQEREPPEEGSWEHWEEHIAEMDRLYEAACEVESTIEESVAAEEFADAVRLRGVHAELQDRDEVNTVLKELQEAVEQEDYARAAELRDSGCAGLLGWWHSRAEDDPVGHILRIAPDFGRYTAVKYTAQDLAELKGWNAEANMLTGYGGGSSLAPMGATYTAAAPQQSRSTGDELAAGLIQATQVEGGNLGVAVMEVFVRRDSQGAWQRQPCVAIPSGEAQQPGPSLPFASGVPPTLDIHVDNGTPGGDVIAMRISLNGSGQPTITDSNSSSIEEVVRRMMGELPTPAGEISGDLGQAQGVQGEAMLVVEEDSASDSVEQSYQQAFERSPANLVRMDNNNFVLTVPASQSGSEAVSEEQLVELEKDPHAQHQAHFDELREALNMTTARDTGITSLVQPPPVRPPQPEESQDSSLAGEKEAAADPWMKAAKEVHRLHNLNNPNTPLPISGDDLADYIKNAASGALDVLQQSYSVPSFCLEGSRVYSRLKQEEMPKTDPFSGLYLGSFGPHGPEILQLKRSVTESGEECVLGVKITGDPNVPAGNVSFRALIGRKHRSSGFDMMYPPELDVQARYPGEGRVAQQGFKDAWWVECELLHFGSNNPMIHGAELGFVWCVPNERRYLILLSRIDLDDPRLNT